MELEESLIPSFVWDFVKKTLKNPIAQGILAMMIYNFMRGKGKKQEDNTGSNSPQFYTTRIPTEKQIVNRFEINNKEIKIYKNSAGKYCIILNNQKLQKDFNNPEEAEKYAREYSKYDYSERLEKLMEEVTKRLGGGNSEEENERIMKEIKKFLDRVNRYAMKPINYEKVKRNNQLRWLSEMLIKEQNNSLWANLSNNKNSSKYFKSDKMDETEGIFFVDIDWLIRKAGNLTGGLGKGDRIRQAFEKGKRLPTPQYWLTDNELGEGNHRVMVAKEFGLKSVPVRVYWK